MKEYLPIFVYGTLKRGQVREGMWPRKPLRVEGATTLGTLYDLGPYPALVSGEDVVEGELWIVAPADLVETLRVLDKIEEVRPDGQGLYERRIITCRSEAGEMHRAYAYYYARLDDLAGRAPIKSGGGGVSFR